MKWTMLLPAAILLLTAAVLLAGCRSTAAVEDDPSTTGASAAPATDAPRTDAGAVLRFHSFDGGGPDYTAVIDDESILRCERRVEYNDPNHAQLDGAGFDVYFDFFGCKAGQTRVTVQERSPLTGNYDTVYQAVVNDALHVELQELYTEDLDAALIGRPTLAIELGSRTVYAQFEENEAADALIAQMEHTSFGLFFEDRDGFAKAALWGGDEIAREDAEQQVAVGDVFLCRSEDGEDLFCICYAAQTTVCTKLAHIEADGAELLAHFGDAEYTEGVMWLEYPE